MIKLSAERLVGNQIYLDVISVGATINLMLAAVRAEGTTIIENAAKEPHIVDTANFLNAAGADIKGAGTDVIKIRGWKPERRPGPFHHTGHDRSGNVYDSIGCHRRRRDREEYHTEAHGIIVRKAAGNEHQR